MSSSDKPVSAELRLFPAPPKKRSPSKKRNLDASRPSTQERSISPGPPPTEDGGRQSAMGARETPPSQHQSQFQPHQFRTASPLTVPPPAELPRSHTSFSEAPTLVRSSSIASLTSPNNNSPLRDRKREPDEPVMRSIFPRYNPELPLEHQPYYPTQSASNTPSQSIPRTVVNRAPYSPDLTERFPAGLQSPMPVGLSAGLFPQHLRDESILEPSTNEEMKGLWKVTNGWRVSPSEGRRYCLRMTSALEEPVHTLSSANSAFYTLRLDPTSTSAIVTLTRQDPNKSKPSSPKLTTSSKPNTGMEVLTTTLEEPSRRLPPNDGLVAVLYPRAASNMAVELATKAARRENFNPITDGDAVIQAAERECGRLVFDSDSQKYYLVHAALATPFYISIHSSPAWSRSEYTLEHPELPRNLIRLTRDGSGMGFLEVDTAVAARIDCFYIVDVAITAVLLVAIAEEKHISSERFEAPPPSIAPMSPQLLQEQLKQEKKKSKSKKKDVKVEEFEMDLESQDSLKETRHKKDKVPGFFGLLWMLIKFFAWLFALFFRGLGKVIMFVLRGCRTKRK